MRSSLPVRVSVCVATAFLSSIAFSQSKVQWVDPADSKSPSFRSTPDSSTSEVSGLYLRNSVGANFLNSISLDNRPWTPEITNVKLKFDTGVAWQIDLGWRFNDLLSVEFSSGLLYNSLSGVSYQVSTPGGSLAISDPWSGSLTQVPFMAGLNLTLPLFAVDDAINRSGLWLRLGGSIGGIYQYIQLDDFNQNGGDVTWSYAGSAGLDWYLRPNISIGVSYRFLGTGSASFLEGLRQETSKASYNQQVMGSLNITF